MCACMMVIGNVQQPVPKADGLVSHPDQLLMAQTSFGASAAAVTGLQELTTRPGTKTS